MFGQQKSHLTGPTEFTGKRQSLQKCLHGSFHMRLHANHGRVLLARGCLIICSSPIECVGGKGLSINTCVFHFREETHIDPAQKQQLAVITGVIVANSCAM